MSSPNAKLFSTFRGLSPPRSAIHLNFTSTSTHQQKHGAMRLLSTRVSLAQLQLCLYRYTRLSRASVRYSSSYIDRTAALPVGSSGHVSFTYVFLAGPEHVCMIDAKSYSVTESHVSKGPNPNVVLYLPPGPKIFQDARPGSDGENSLHIQHYLASVTSSTIVTVHYRLGTEQLEPETETESAVTKHYTFPIPIHDTLAVFDWVQDTFQPTQLSILGTHIGGSIALTLALTESRAVHAVAVVEPICDWTGLDGYCLVDTEDSARDDSNAVSELENDFSNMNMKETDDYDVLEEPGTPQPLRKGSPGSTSTSARAPPDLLALLAARETYFTKPAAYFDPFASPLLFLRSPGKGVPVRFPRYHTGPEYPVPILQRGSSGTHPLLDLWDGGAELPPGVVDVNGEYIQTGSTTAAATGDALEAYVPRYRKTLVRWPPLGLDHARFIGSHRRLMRLQMTLPWVKFYVNGLSAQSEPAVQSGVGRRRSKRGTTVLAQQADEMVNVMRRACFWGRDKEAVERGVVLSGSVEDGTCSVLEKEAAGWLRDIYSEKR